MGRWDFSSNKSLFFVSRIVCIAGVSVQRQNPNSKMNPVVATIILWISFIGFLLSVLSINPESLVRKCLINVYSVDGSDYLDDVEWNVECDPVPEFHKANPYSLFCMIFCLGVALSVSVWRDCRDRAKVDEPDDDVGAKNYTRLV